MPQKDYQARKEYYRQYYQNRRLISDHHCVDCGKLIERRSTRCLSCSIKKVWEGRRVGRRKVKGYIYVYKPDHYRALKDGYVLEHILVWEQAHGKPLPKGWEVHHLNGIRDDNRPVNLQALPNMKHKLVLQAKAKRIQELEALLNNQHQLL